MKLKVKNIGRIYDETEIEINGITVLAGENGTGKSTLGKIIYCIFSTFYDYNDQIIQERINSIYRYIRRYALNKTLLRREFSKVRDRIGDLVENYNTSRDSVSVKKTLSELLECDLNEVPDDLISMIQDALDMDESDILRALLLKNIEAEFDSQLGHVKHADEESVVEVSIQNQKIRFSYSALDVSIQDALSLVKEIVYIDDPNVLDNIGTYYGGDYLAHGNSLKYKLSGRKKEEMTALDDVLTRRKMDNLYSKIAEVCKGEIKENNNGSFSYRDSELDSDIVMSNLSTGLKSFVIMKTLLEKGYLENNGMVVLDEPEIHLHPEWMQIYAEIIVLLQSTLGINFIISTHSADFLGFIELFTKKYAIDSKCKYYLLSRDNKDFSVTHVKDVSTDIGKIYSKLSKPFLRASEELDVLNEEN